MVIFSNIKMIHKYLQRNSLVSSVSSTLFITRHASYLSNQNNPLLITYPEQILMRQCFRKIENEEDIHAIYRVIQKEYKPVSMSVANHLKSRLQLRWKIASDYFWIFSLNNTEIFGYINGIRTSQEKVSIEYCDSHDPNGKTLVLHSVFINSHYRRFGYGRLMVRLYLNRMIRHTDIERVLVLGNKNLLCFFSDCGFSVSQVSNIAIGKV